MSLRRIDDRPLLFRGCAPTGAAGTAHGPWTRTSSSTPRSGSRGLLR